MSPDARSPASYDPPASRLLSPLDSLWLRAQQDVAGRAAHEVKNALNGVAVNLEVVRVLAARAGGGEQVTRFAGVAAEQLELLVRQVEALLGVTRARDGLADVAAIARQLHALLERAGAAGSTLRLDSPDGVTAPTSVPLDLARLLIAGVLANLVDAPAGGALRVRAGDDGRVAVTATADPAPAAWLDDESRALAHAGGVAVLAAGDGSFTLIFPAASPATTV